LNAIPVGESVTIDDTTRNASECHLRVFNICILFAKSEVSNVLHTLLAFDKPAYYPASVAGFVSQGLAESMEARAYVYLLMTLRKMSGEKFWYSQELLCI